MKSMLPIRRRWLLLALALVVAGLAGLGHFRAMSLRGEGQDTETTPNQALYRPVACYGVVELEDEIRYLNPTVPGRVAEVLVGEGDHVAAKAPLFRMDDKIARDTVESAKAALAMAQTNLEKARNLPERHRIAMELAESGVRTAQAQRQTAREALEHKLKLERLALPVNLDERFMAEKELHLAEDNLQARQAEVNKLKLDDPNRSLRAAEIAVDQAKADVMKAEDILAEYVVRAPTAGTVLQITVRPGNTLPVLGSQAAIDFGPDSPRVIRADVEQAFASMVVVGLRAKIEDDTHAAGTWNGSVKHVSDRFSKRLPNVSETLQLSDVRTMKCLIELDPGQPTLRLGLRVLVTIQVPLH